MSDAFQSNAKGLTSPGANWEAVTPHDENELPNLPRGIYVGGSGNIAMVGENGEEITFALATGVIHPLRPKIIKATGTTATSIVAVW